MDCATPLAGGGDICLQMLQALGATSPPPAGGELPVTILSREGVTQGDPLSMVLYRITLIPLAEELQAADPGLLSPFYANDADFDGSEGCSAQLLKLLMRRGPDRGYFPEPAKSIFILDTPGQEEAESGSLL